MESHYTALIKVKYSNISITNFFFFFFFLIKKKGLVDAFIVPTHLNPSLTWRGTQLGNNKVYHYPNPQLPDSQV